MQYFILALFTQLEVKINNANLICLSNFLGIFHLGVKWPHLFLNLLPGSCNNISSEILRDVKIKDIQICQISVFLY